MIAACIGLVVTDAAVMSEQNSTRILPVIGFSSIISAYLFIIIPLTIYIGNVDEFIVPIETILKNFIKPTVFLISILTLTGYFIPKYHTPRYVTALAILSVLIWVQGYVFTWDYGQFDGKSIDWTTGIWRGVVDLSVWIFFGLTALFIPSKTFRYATRFALVIFIMQTINIGVGAYEIGEALHSKTTKIDSRLSEQDIYRFAQNGNVLHIIADGFQSDIFEEIINSPESGKIYTDAMDGFTFFREHLGAFPLTHMTIPAIFTGKIYRNHMLRSEFLDSALSGNSILNLAMDNGYDVDLAIPSSLNSIYKRSNSTNTFLLTGNHHVKQMDYELDESAKLMDLSLFRISPHFIKRYIYNDQKWLTQSLLSKLDTVGLRFFSHNAFLNDMTHNLSTDRPKPVYKLLHLMLSHNPMVATSDCNYAGAVIPTVRENVLNQSRCSLTNVINLFNRMKQLGIYENTTIVFMGDHGAWVPPKGLKSFRSRDGRTSMTMNPITVAMALPVMAIKPAGETGPLKTSEAQTSLAEIASTIASLIGLDANFDGTSYFDIDPNITRTRKHYHYQYSRSEWTADYLAPITEFIINGKILDSSSWRLGNRYVPSE